MWPRRGATLDELMGLMDRAEMPDTVEVADYHVEAADGHQVLVRVYRPGRCRDRSPGLYWMHGGGMVLGSVDMNDASCAAIAADLDRRGGFRRLPPGARVSRIRPPLEDCYTGLLWFFDQAETLGLDTRPHSCRRRKRGWRTSRGGSPCWPATAQRSAPASSC